MRSPFDFPDGKFDLRLLRPGQAFPILYSVQYNTVVPRLHGVKGYDRPMETSPTTGTED
jgi:hypothetical protein